MKIKTKTSELKRAQEELKKPKNGFRNLFEHAVDPIVILDSKGYLISLNKKVEEILGYKKEELVGRHFAKLNILTLKSKAITLKNFAQRMLGKKILPYEIEVINKKGEIIPVEINASIVQLGKKTLGDMVIFRDLRRRKRAEEKLRESEEKFRAVFEGAGDGILVADIKTKKFAFANPKICEITGYSLKELLKLDVSKIHPKKDLPHVVDQFNKQVEDKITVAKDIPVLRKDKKVIYCDVNSKVIEIGKQKYLVGFFRDITKRKKLEKQRLESNRRLQRLAQKLTIARDELKVAIETKGEFVNIAAHELKTPLQPIVGYADRLLHSGKPTQWQKERLNIILDNAKHLQKLVQDVLDINKMETGIMKFSMEECDLLKIIKEVYESFKPTVEEKGLKFIFDTSKTSDKIQVKGDPSRLNQLFSNLLDNAAKFTNKGSITVQVKEEKNMVTINVKDTGIGIAKNDMPKLFHKFFQADGSNKRKWGGTGLGLTICKEIIKAHKGKISAQSTLDEGSSFQVVLPKLVRSS